MMISECNNPLLAFILEDQGGLESTLRLCALLTDEDEIES